MAKVKKKEQKEGHFKKFKAFMKLEATQFSLGVILFLVSFYVLLSMVSFLFTGAADQSIILAPDRDELKDEILNWTGYSGALLAEWLMNDSFGLAAYILLVFPFVLSLRLMKVRTVRLWKVVLGSALFVVWTSIFLSFIIGPFTDSTFLNVGGAHGSAMKVWLTSNVGIPGTFLILFGTGILFSVFTFSATIPFIRNLFIRKPKADSAAMTAVNDDVKSSEKSVKIGDDIVPKEWVIDSENDSEPVAVDEDDEEEVEEDDDVVKPIVVVHDGIVVEQTPAFDEPIAPTAVPIEVITSDVELKSTIPDDGEMVDENDESFSPYDPTLDLSNYKYPTLDLLKEYPAPQNAITKEEQEMNQKRIITTLKHFGIGVKKIFETIGPTITLYEITIEDGVRISKIRNLEADIMLSLAAKGIRIIAPIPGKGTIGIEVPNSNPRTVSMYATIASKKFQESTYDLPVALGRTITNEVFMFDLCKMPHLLVAGATGQGKSVGLNAIITSLLYKKHPSQLKFVLVDPKKVEFNIYCDIEKQFLAKLPDVDEPVITDTTKVVQTLNSLCKEMDHRYDLLKQAHVRNIKEYNDKFINRRLNPLKGHKYLPYIVVIIDEFGDLIMTAGKEVEMPIARIAQLARAVGIHMILATQRPSVNIITGVIKANFPARIAFKVASGIDSKTILDGPGAQQLVGKGDLLFSQGNEPVRVQCAFVDTPEVENIVSYVSQQQGYPSAFLLPEPDVAESENDLSGVDMSKRDPLFEEAARLIVSSQQGSTSNIQRKFSIGYNRAGRIVDQLEVAGIVGPFEGSKPRQVLVQTEYELEKVLQNM